MPLVSKKFTFENVANQATFLGNIRTVIDETVCGPEFAWIIDRFTPGNDGELLIHSNGLYDNQNLYFSIRLLAHNENTSNIHLCGQTDYSTSASYDNQPGRFTITPQGMPIDKQRNMIVAPTTKQIIFVNKQLINVFWQEDLYYNGVIYPIWRRFTLGAMIGLIEEEETLLNFVNEMCASGNGWSGSPFMGNIAHSLPATTGSGSGVGRLDTPRFSGGLLWKQPYDNAPLNKDTGFNGAAGNPRWFSTLHAAEDIRYSYYYLGQSFNATASFWNSDRLVANYNNCTRFNVSAVKHFLHRPIVFLYEEFDSVNIFVHPIGYLPYYGIRMSTMLKGDDTISYGSDNYAVFPILRDNIADGFGMAIKYIEGD